MTKAVFLGGQYAGTSMYVLNSMVDTGFIVLPVNKAKPPEWVEDEQPEVSVTAAVETYELVEYIATDDIAVFKIRAISEVKDTATPTYDKVVSIRVKYALGGPETYEQHLAQSIAESIVESIERDREDARE